MVVENKKLCSSTTWSAMALAAGLLSLFTLTWQTSTFPLLAFEAVISGTIASLIVPELKQERAQVIHGAVLIVAAFPWVFYLILALIQLMLTA